jgi:hypothetical protein
MKKKVFIYVGHSNWGKSFALKIITGNNSKRKTVQIAQYNVRVRKMSNDDDGTGLLNWVRTFPIQAYQRFIIAFCPNVPPITGNATLQQNIALDILLELQANNILYFFVQEEKFNFPQIKISQTEINWIRTFGTVQVLPGQNVDTVRAAEFSRFISTHI